MIKAPIFVFLRQEEWQLLRVKSLVEVELIRACSHHAETCTLNPQPLTLNP